ncbi:MAG: hypothetical protein H0W69_05280 [Gemmatimonadaceae bacterium]|nr:hypothetical protein [Gemmatimonadaceae bacterium]
MSESLLFTPLRVGNVELADRIVIAPMCQYAASNHHSTLSTRPVRLVSLAE